MNQAQLIEIAYVLLDRSAFDFFVRHLRGVSEQKRRLRVHAPFVCGLDRGREPKNRKRTHDRRLPPGCCVFLSRDRHAFEHSRLRELRSIYGQI